MYYILFAGDLRSIERQSRFVVIVESVADWPTGKPGDFPVGPSFMKFFWPPAVHANLFIHYRLTQSADSLSIQCAGHDVRRVSLSERMTVMYLIHSPAGYTAYQNENFF